MSDDGIRVAGGSGDDVMAVLMMAVMMIMKMMICC